MIRRIATSLAVAVTSAALAGDLNPPAGPVSPTMKTLAEVEPRLAINGTNTPGDADAMFKITNAGSYYATGSITVGSGRGYLEIAASNVTVDLSGFRIAGAAGSLDGIWIGAGVANVRIVNGTLATFAGDGIDLTNAWGTAVDSIHVANCTGTGIRSGPSGMLRQCVVISCGGDGFDLAAGALAERCSARGCSQNGFFASGNAMMTNCTSSSNFESGFLLASGSAVEHCEAAGNSEHGVEMAFNADAARVTDCSVSLNVLEGIYANRGSLIKGNTILSAAGTTSIYLFGDGNRVEGNTTRGTGSAITRSADAEDNFVIANWHYSGNGSNGFANFNPALNVVGPVITANGTIATTNPWANFSR